MNYSDVLKNKHFNNLAAIVRVAFLSPEWKKKHPEVPFWLLVDNLKKLTQIEMDWNKQAVIVAATDLLVAITMADDRLSYAEDDLQWLIAMIDSAEYKTIFTLWMAWFSAQDEMLTPAEVAEQTGTSESQWRNKAAAGEIPGAAKSGGTWMLPRSVLRAKEVIK